MSRYLPVLQQTNKADITIKEMMTHHSGLWSWLKFYENTLAGTKRNPIPSSKFYKKKTEEGFDIPVTEKLFLQSTYTDTIRSAIYNSELRASKNYKYSDLGFYLIADMVKEVTGIPLDEYVSKAFYEPMGLTSMTFNPIKKIAKERIPPTEEDTYFRRQRIQGYVHDMGSAMLGGVSGHAGLFSNARDLAVLMELLNRGGEYGGKQYLSPFTIVKFTQRCEACTRRGIGFDMKQLDVTKTENMSSKASIYTFGHLGFTGTCVWVDPIHHLTYVLLSNRTYPSMFNYKFSKENYRPRIQTIIYEAMEKNQP
jgi:CubicO group peptidase (beta-lactamase class C family)